MGPPQYRPVTDGDPMFRNRASAIVWELFEHLYRGWKAAGVTEADIRQEFGWVTHVPSILVRLTFASSRS